MTEEEMDKAYSEENKHRTWVALGSPNREPTEYECFAFYLCWLDENLPTEPEDVLWVIHTPAPCLIAGGFFVL